MIPDFLANAGGATCSYFEQVQSLTAAFHAVSELAKKRKLGMRDAAYVIATH